MTKEMFKDLFRKALLIAAEKGEAQAKINLPRAFMIDLQAFDYSGPLMTVDQAVDRIYLTEDKFFKIIDIAVTGVHPQYAIAFVRVSGHAPGLFSDTFNPNELGPFNIMTSKQIDKLD